MAYTAAQIDKLPISPEAKAGLYAKYGLVEDLSAPEPAVPVLIDTAKPAPVAAPPPPKVTATPGGQPLASGFAVDPREAYVNQAKASGAFLTEDAAIGGFKPPAPPKQIEVIDQPTVNVAQAQAEAAYVAGAKAPVPMGASIGGKPVAPTAPMTGAPMGGGGGLPLQAPVVAEGQYKGFDPLHFGKSPGQQKVDTIQGARLLAEGQFAEQEAGIDARTAEDYGAVAQKVAMDADARAAEAEKKAGERKAFLAKYNAETERQINDYANAKIDPARFWAGSQGTGNAIAATIGAFVSGIAGYLDPSKDYVGQFTARIEQKIQQDIDLQKAEVAKKGQAADARRGLYANYLQQFGQEDAAEAMAYETYLRKTKAQIDSYASKATSEKAKVQLGALSAALDDRQKMWAANRQAAGESMIDSYYAAQAKAQAAAAAAAYARDKADDDATLRILEKKGPELDIVGIKRFKYGERLPNGMIVTNRLGMPVGFNAAGQIVDTGTISAKAKAEGGGNAVTTISGFNEKGEPIYGQGTLVGKDPKVFNEAQSAYTSIKQDLKTIRDLRAKHGGGALWSVDDIATANAAASRVQLALKSPAFFQLGVIAGPDKDYLTSQMPDKPLEVKVAGAWGSDPIGKQLDSVETYLDAKYKNAEATHVKGGAAKNSALPLKKAE